MGQMILIAFRNLVQHTRRTVMLGGAIAVVTSLLVFLMALADGAQSALFASATTMVTGHINVTGLYKPTPSQVTAAVTHAPKVLEVVRREVSPAELDYVIERGRGWAKLVSDTGSLQLALGGINVAQEKGLARSLRIVEGNLAELAQPNTLLLFEDHARKLDVKVGDALTIAAQTPQGTNNTLGVRVAAIAKTVGLLSGSSAYVPLDSLRTLYQLKPDTTGTVLLYLKDVSKVPVVQARLREALKREGYRVANLDARPFWTKYQSAPREDWMGQRLDVTTWEMELSSLTGLIQGIRIGSGVLLFILVTIICVGVMNTSWIAIRERTREIGTLRAIGMHRLRVMVLFLTESLLLGFASTGAGALLGGLGCVLLNALSVPLPSSLQGFLMSERLQLLVSPPAVLTAIVGITACVTVVSLFPSYLAARLKPVTAMHHLR